MRELTLIDLQHFEEWLFDECGIRDMETGMQKIGRMRSIIKLLQFAGYELPETLKVKELDKIVGDLGLPFQVGGPPV